MNIDELKSVANAIVAPQKGVLAADESSPTIKKRFASIQVESTEENRRRYREILFPTDGIERQIGGVILFDETLRQRTRDDIPFPQLLSGRGIIPGIKVDQGAKALAQEAGLVPIVEPEVLMDGAHGIERCEVVTAQVLQAVFAELDAHRVLFEGMLLKPNMVIAGKKCPRQAGVQGVAEATLRCLRRYVPAAGPGIVFLSGGQSAEDATDHLSAMNALGAHPWQVSFSYGRALQAPVLAAWQGQESNVTAAQQALLNRCHLNGLARAGKYARTMEGT